jgi:hypothetical protein
VKWWRNLKSSVAADRSGSGVNRGGMKTKKPFPASGGGPTPGPGGIGSPIGLLIALTKAV